MQFLLSELRLASDQKRQRDIMRKSVPTTMQDVVLVFVTVSGMQRRRLRAGSVCPQDFAQRARAQPAVSAIQITTAAGICAAVDLFRTGKLPQSGFIRQEQVALPDFLANRSASLTSSRAHRVHHRVS